MPTRRSFLATASACLFAAATSAADAQPSTYSDNDRRKELKLSPSFPCYPSDMIQEIVTFAHFDLDRLKALLQPRPQLANAAWDWGFGDWETPLGAACHMGRRDIAQFLIDIGAPPTLFSSVLFGDVDTLKHLVERNPGIQRVAGPHSISLLAHARMAGKSATEIARYLESLGDSDLTRPAPFSKEEASSICGDYHVDADPAVVITVSNDMDMYAKTPMYTYPPQLNFTRKGAMARPLFHRGDRSFYPAGAPRVEVKFASTEQGATLTVSDGAGVLAVGKLGS
jgi:hypothetical protein